MIIILKKCLSFDLGLGLDLKEGMEHGAWRWTWGNDLNLISRRGGNPGSNMILKNSDHFKSDEIPQPLRCLWIT